MKRKIENEEEPASKRAKRTSTEDRAKTKRINSSTFPAVFEQSRGKKQYQQDRVLIYDEVDFGDQLKGKWNIYCVFDGHGGHNVSQWLKENFKDILVKHLKEEIKDDPTGKQREARVKKGILESIKDAEAQLMNHEGLSDGSTAVICLLDGTTNTVTTANLGDSRAILARMPKKEGSGVKAIQLSQDHTAGAESEKKRIAKAGGLVFDGRVQLKREVKEIQVKTGDSIATMTLTENRSLEVSRSFGDRDYKGAGVIAIPYMSKFTIIPGRDKFLLLACDGLFEEWKNKEVVEFVYDKLFIDPTKPTMQDSLRALMRETILFRNAKDNTSVILVLLDKSSRSHGFW